MEESLAGALLALADGAQCATRLSIRSPPGTHVTLPWENLQKRHIMDQQQKTKKNKKRSMSVRLSPKEKEQIHSA